MKVDLLTLQCIKNYGSVLQTYATEQILQEFFDEVETINYIRSDSADENMMKEWTKNDKGLKKIIKRILLEKLCVRYQEVFNSFLTKYTHLTDRKYYCDQDFNKYPLEADAYCIGSDQVWNTDWNNGILPAMYLSFAPDDKLKFALCSSFGKTEIDEVERQDVAALLNRLKYISVRESTALPVLEQMNIKGAEFLLDPTLLFDSSFWSEIASQRLVSEEYVLVYQLNENKEFDDYAVEFAKRKNLKLVFIGMRMKDKKKNGQVIMMPYVEEFLSLIKYASYVITDSFHGTAFSINFNREVIVIYPGKFSTRLYSILNWAGLLDRHLENFENFNIADNVINYEIINEKLDIERRKARTYLKKVRG